MFKQLRPAVVSFILFTIITGIVYPAIVTGFAKALYPGQARGSLIKISDKPVGSELLAQGFSDPKHFWPRPSAVDYNGTGASGSNLAASNPAFVDAVKRRIDALHSADPANADPIPADLVTASASGLDPHISPAAAEYQAARVARARSVPLETIRDAISRHTQRPVFGMIGESRVNVLTLNLELDHPELAQPLAQHQPGMSRGLGFEP